MLVAKSENMRLAACLILILVLSAWEQAVNAFDSASLSNALNLIKSNKADEAVSILSRYEPRKEERYSYHQAYARALAQSKNQYESIAHYRLAYLHAKEREDKERALMEQAETYSAMGNHYEALAGFKSLLKRFPDSRYAQKAYLGVADSLYCDGLFKEAVTYYERAGQSERAAYGKANALQSMGKTQEAHDLYTSMNGKDAEYLKSSPETLYLMAENLRLMGKTSDAKVHLGFIKSESFRDRVDKSLGLMALQEGKLDDAVKYLTSLHRSADRQLRREALLTLAKIYIRLGKIEEAKSRLLDVRNNYPYGKDYDEAILNLGQIYKREGKLRDAVSLWRELIFRPSPNTRALDELESLILDLKSKNGDEFVALWKSVGRKLLEPSRSDSLLKIAQGLKSSGGPYIEVCSWLQKNGNESAKTECRVALADFYSEIGDLRTASQLFNDVRSKGRSDAILRIEAKMHYSNMEYQKALTKLQAIKEAKEEDMILLADTIDKTGNAKSAVASYQRSLSKDGGSPRTYIKLADMLYKTGGKSDALQYYKIAVRTQEAVKQLSATDREWVLYRIATLSAGKEPLNALKGTEKGNILFNRYAEAGLKAAAIAEIMERSF